MDTFGIDIGEIVELDTQIASSGALGTDEAAGSTWEQIIAVVVSIRAPDPS